MQNHIIFTFPVYSDDHSVTPTIDIENHMYWASLLEYFSAKSDTIEIHCWNEEDDTIEEVRSLPIEEIDILKEGKLTIFKSCIPYLLSHIDTHKKAY